MEQRLTGKQHNALTLWGYSPELVGADRVIGDAEQLPGVIV